MIKWEKEKCNNGHMYITTIKGIEVAFKYEFDTSVWKYILRFDRDNHEGNPKILKINGEALRWERKLRKEDEITEYLKIFAPHYLNLFNCDFDKIPQTDLINSGNSSRLLKLGRGNQNKI